MPAVVTRDGVPTLLHGSMGGDAQVAINLQLIDRMLVRNASPRGRRPRRLGIKLVAGVPYAFVDTSDAWFEPRRRIAVSAAGPGADLVLAGAFALAALASSGAAADVAFQLALGGYIGALMNLNPLLERDGYHVLIDLLGEADLRRRAQRRLLWAIARRGAAQEPRAVSVYAGAALAWDSPQRPSSR